MTSEAEQQGTKKQTVKQLQNHRDGLEKAAEKYKFTGSLLETVG